MRSQKSASDVELGAVMVEVWNASPRGNTLMAILNTVIVTRTILHFVSGPKSQFTALVSGTRSSWALTHILVCCGIPYFSINFDPVLFRE